MADYMTPEVYAAAYPMLYAKYEKDYKDWATGGGMQAGTSMPVPPAPPPKPVIPVQPITQPAFAPPDLSKIVSSQISPNADDIYGGQTYKTMSTAAPVNQVVANTGPTNTAPNWGVRFREWGNNIFNKPVGTTTVMPPAPRPPYLPSDWKPFGQTVYRRPQSPMPTAAYGADHIILGPKYINGVRVHTIGDYAQTPEAAIAEAKRITGSVGGMRSIPSEETGEGGLNRTGLMDGGTGGGAAPPWDGGTGTSQYWAPALEVVKKIAWKMVQPSQAQQQFMNNWKAAGLAYPWELPGLFTSQSFPYPYLAIFVDGYMAAGNGSAGTPITQTPQYTQPAPTNTLAFTRPQPFMPRMRAF